MFQIAIWGPKQLYIRVTLSKYYVLEMIKYHLKIKPITQPYKKADLQIWHHHPKLAKSLQTTYLENIDPDILLDEYLAAIQNMTGVVNKSTGTNRDKALEQLADLIELEQKIRWWSYIQFCKKKTIEPDTSEFWKRFCCKNNFSTLLGYNNFFLCYY